MIEQVSLSLVSPPTGMAKPDSVTIGKDTLYYFVLALFAQGPSAVRYQAQRNRFEPLFASGPCESGRVN